MCMCVSKIPVEAAGGSGLKINQTDLSAGKAHIVTRHQNHCEMQRNFGDTSMVALHTFCGISITVMVKNPVGFRDKTRYERHCEKII